MLVAFIDLVPIDTFHQAARYSGLTIVVFQIVGRASQTSLPKMGTTPAKWIVWFGVLMICTSPPCLRSQTHPLPNCFTPASLTGLEVVKLESFS